MSYYNNNRNQLFTSNSNTLARGKPGGSNIEQSHMLEEENNRMIDDLSDQVGLLKSLSLRIQKDIKDHDVLIGEIDKGFDSTGELLSAAMKKLGSLMNQGGANYFLILTGFIFLLFLGMYFFLRK
jgi:hypothetical protein